MPNWLGDGVMATPFLRALRDLYPEAHIAALARPIIAPVLSGLPFVNDTHISKIGDQKNAAAWLRGGKFDLAVLLPNSFRSAWTARAAKVPRRLGYARGWRSLLLTDKLPPLLKSSDQRAKDRAKRAAIRDVGKRAHTKLPAVGGYQPVPTIDYYLALAQYLGADISSPSVRRMELAITGAEREESRAILAAQGISDEPTVVLVPGANFGSSKCWPPERFAGVADMLMDHHGPFAAHVLIASSPAEMPIVAAILAASHLGPSGRLTALAKLNDGRGVSLGALKEIVRRSTLMICNDTGPRHFACALGVPVVTLFGPTDPVWAETYFDKERQVRIDVPCGPCQLKKCPIDHRCLTGLTVDLVLAAVRDLWPKPAAIADWRDEPDLDPRRS
jgi:heptosyltransferase II